MSKHSGKIGLYLLLIVALIAGYLYLNDQVSTQGSYTMGQLEKALEEDKVTDAVIHQNREVPTGYVTANNVSDGQKTVYVTDVKEAEALLEEHDIDPTIRNVPKDSSMIGTVLPVVLTGAILLFFFMNSNLSRITPTMTRIHNHHKRIFFPLHRHHSCTLSCQPEYAKQQQACHTHF